MRSLMLALAATGMIAGAGTDAAAAKPATWWHHAIIYEIYPRSFQDSDGDGIGDLRGITRRLNYLQKLGVDAIWVTPFFSSPNADFGYDVSDYMAIDPRFGTMADWDQLVREAKRRNIRVLVDLVLNHSSDQHPWFRESRSSRSNPKRDWYVWHDPAPGGGPPTNWKAIFPGPTWTLDPKTGQYYYHIFLPQQPDLNWRSPGLRAAMYDVVRFWLKHGAAGFRLDATPYLFEDPSWPEDPDVDHGAPIWLKPYNSQRPENHQVLREMRSILDGFPGDPVLLGESATSSIAQLRAVYGAKADEINLPMNFLVGNMIKLDAAAFKKAYDEAATKLDGLPPVSFFSSHDHQRQWSSFGAGKSDRDADRIAKLTAALILLTPGTALLCYGEEIGMRDEARTLLNTAPIGEKRPRADDRDPARTPMQWSAARNAGFTSGTPWLPVEPHYATDNVAAQEDDPASILGWYRKLAALRRNDPAFDGQYVPLDSGNPTIFAFGRVAPDGSARLVMVNCSGSPQAARVSGWSRTIGAVIADSDDPKASSGAPLAPFATRIVSAER